MLEVSGRETCKDNMHRGRWFDNDSLLAQLPGCNNQILTILDRALALPDHLQANEVGHTAMSVQSVNRRQPLAAVSRAKGLIDLVVVGSDSQIYHKAYNDSGWQDWISLGGDFADEAPALVAVTSERLDVFGRDRSTKKLMHSAWTNGTWTTEWDSPEGPEFERRFETQSSQNGQIDLFGTANGRLYYRSVCCVLHDWQLWDMLTRLRLSMKAGMTGKTGTRLSCQT